MTSKSEIANQNAQKVDQEYLGEVSENYLQNQPVKKLYRTECLIDTVTLEQNNWSQYENFVWTVWKKITLFTTVWLKSQLQFDFSYIRKKFVKTF